jgi:AcrR family transcriptional regulator
MARRNDHSREEIREMALAAGEKIVAQDGYKGLSTRKVASAIGYTAGTLYLVFESQEDMVLQLNGRTLDMLYEWLHDRAAHSVEPRDNLLALGDAYIAFAQTETPRWNLLFEFITTEGEVLPEWYLAKLSKVFGLVEAALKPLAGHRSALEIQQAARVLWASVHGICTLKIHQRIDLAGGQSTGEMVRMLVDNFLHGFQA